MLKFGAHMGVSGGLHNGLLEGKEIGCDAVQIFTSSPRQWYARPLTDDAIKLFKDAATETGISPRIAHDSYLINLASPSAETREKSLDAFVAELTRCEALGLDFLVSHPGAHLGEGEDIGIQTISASLDEAHRRTAGFKVKVALETTAAKGTTLGGKLEHFPQIFGQVKEPERLVVCIDTCHLFDAGYDIRDATAFWDTFESIVGFGKLAVCHANDSKFGLGSHRDHHAHIGEGTLGDDAFRSFLTDPRLPDGLPVIVETPVEESKGHKENVAKLRELYQSVRS